MKDVRLSRETSAVLKDSNNECRGVRRGQSSRSQAEQGEGPNNSQRQSRMYVPMFFSDEWQRSKRQWERPQRARRVSIGSGNQERRKMKLIEHD